MRTRGSASRPPQAGWPADLLSVGLLGWAELQTLAECLVNGASTLPAGASEEFNVTGRVLRQALLTSMALDESGAAPAVSTARAELQLLDGGCCRHAAQQICGHAAGS